MKTRHGFVSNSSCTSFCIYGCTLDVNNWYAYSDAGCFVRLMKKIKQEFPSDYIASLNDIKQKYKDNEYVQKQIEVMETIDEIKISDGQRLLLIDENCHAEFELASDMMESFGLSFFADPGNGCLWIGRPWSCIGDDQTGGHFKLKIEELIHSLFGEECSTYEEAWGDY